jgi:hypothetical protein
MVIPRRQFLVLGTAAVAGVATTSLTAGIRRAASPRESTPKIAVGFANATMQEFVDPGFAIRIIDAARVGADAGSFDGAVDLRVHGAVRADRNAPQSRLTMGIDAMYRVSGPEPEVPFMAWTYAAQAGSQAAGSFRVPIQGNRPTSLLVTAQRADSGSLREMISFAQDDRRGTYRLRRGLYFIGIDHSGIAAPDWSSVLAVGAEQGNLPVLREHGASPVTFDYIVVAADHA